MFLNHSRTPAPIVNKLALLISLDPGMIIGGQGQGHPRSKVTGGKIVKFAVEFNRGHQRSFQGQPRLL